MTEVDLKQVDPGHDADDQDTSHDVDRLDHDQDIDEDFQSYRAISKSAIAAMVMAFLGLFLMMFTWSMLLLPLAGVVFGLIALSNIRRYPNELTGMLLAKLGIAVCLLVFLGGITTAVVIHVTEVPDGYSRISFYDLNIDQNAASIPPALHALDGKRVFLKGYVHPGISDSGEVRQFVLVEDMGTCCFGGQPEMADMVEVTITVDATVKYSRRLRRLGGTFRIAPNPKKAVGGLKGGLFKLEADYVR